MARARSPFAGFLAFLGGLALVLGIVGLWANRTIGDGDAFASLAGRLLAQDVIVTRLANAIVDPVLERATPEVRQHRRVIVATTEEVLQNPAFVSVFQDVLRDAHQQLLVGDGDVKLHLDSALAAVIVEIRKVAPQVADQLSGVDAPDPTILSASQVSRVRGFIDFERTASLVLVIIGAILIVIALIGGGPRALVPAGMTVAVIAAIVLLLVFGVRSLVGIEVTGASRDAANSAYGVVVEGLRTTLIVAAVLGVVGAVVGGVLGRRQV
jgi:hypothetical protein